MSNRGSIKLTVFFEDQFWIGIFERTLEVGYSVARNVFGSEPSEPELHAFLLHNTGQLKFTAPDNAARSIFKKKNPKRMKREAIREMCKQKTITKAHAAIKKEHGENKILKKYNLSERKREEVLEKFIMKQLKKKEKLRGH